MLKMMQKIAAMLLALTLFFGMSALRADYVAVAEAVTEEMPVEEEPVEEEPAEEEIISEPVEENIPSTENTEMKEEVPETKELPASDEASVTEEEIPSEEEIPTEEAADEELAEEIVEELSVVEEAAPQYSLEGSVELVIVSDAASLKLGDIVEMRADVTGYEGCDLCYKWSVSLDGGETWMDAPGDNSGAVYTFELDEEKGMALWQIEVTPVAPEAAAE